MPRTALKDAILLSVGGDKELGRFFEKIEGELEYRRDEYFGNEEEIRKDFQSIFPIEEQKCLCEKFIILVKFHSDTQRDIEKLLQECSNADPFIRAFVNRYRIRLSLSAQRWLLGTEVKFFIKFDSLGKEVVDKEYVNGVPALNYSDVSVIVDNLLSFLSLEEEKRKRRKLNKEEEEDVEMEDKEVSIEDVIDLLKKNKTEIHSPKPKAIDGGFKFVHIPNRECFRTILETLQKNLNKQEGIRNGSSSSVKPGFVGVFGGCGIGKSRLLFECTKEKLQAENRENGVSKVVGRLLKDCECFNVSYEIEQGFFNIRKIEEILSIDDVDARDKQLGRFFESFHVSVLLRGLYTISEKMHCKVAVIGELIEKGVDYKMVPLLIEKLWPGYLGSLQKRILILYKNDETQFLGPMNENPVFYNAKRKEAISLSELVFSSYLYSLNRIRLLLSHQSILLQGFIAGNLPIRGVVDLSGSGFDVYSVSVGIEESVEGMIESDATMSNSMRDNYPGEQHEIIYKRIDVGSGRVPLFVEKFGDAVVAEVRLQNLFASTYDKVLRRISKARMPIEDMRMILYLMLRRKKLEEVRDEKLAKDLCGGFVYLDKEKRICQPPFVLKYYSTLVKEFEFYGKFIDGYFSGDQDYIRFEKQIGEFFTFKYNLLRNLGLGKKNSIKFGELFEGSYMLSGLRDDELPLTLEMEFVRCQSMKFESLKSVQTSRSSESRENYEGKTVCVWVGGQDENQDVVMFIFDGKKYHIIQLEIKKHRKSAVFGKKSKDGFPIEFSKANDRDFEVDIENRVFGYINTTTLESSTFNTKVKRELEENSFIVLGNNFVEVFGNILLCDFFES